MSISYSYAAIPAALTVRSVPSVIQSHPITPTVTTNRDLATLVSGESDDYTVFVTREVGRMVVTEIERVERKTGEGQGAKSACPGANVAVPTA